jgi:chaperonin GroEL
MLSNPLPAPNEDIDLNHFGYGVQSFEMQRAKSTIVGFSDEESVFERADTLKVQAKSSNSLLDQSIIEERIGKLTGGIAKLTVVGSSYGEIREKKDRAEDAVRAVQGAIAHGCLPAGGWTLLSIGNILCKKYEGDKIVEEILVPALQEPVYRLLSNIGFNEADAEKLFSEMLVDVKGVAPKQAIIFDALHRKKVNAVESGLLDSTPAVLEAIRNSLSIATLLGTLGGCVVYHRDLELERRESQDTNAFLRASSVDTE